LIALVAERPDFGNDRPGAIVQHLELDSLQWPQAGELALVFQRIGDRHGSALDADHALLLVDLLNETDSIIKSWSGLCRLHRRMRLGPYLPCKPGHCGDHKQYR
jgi:hypothetical protein